jgi:hypothetical protein
LACFLAETIGVPGHSGIVVDDPVSSLDHLRTERVARRLAEEARSGRQVIVFTHDLVFSYAIRAEAAATQTPIVTHWLRRGADNRPGIVAVGEDPWQLKKVPARIGTLTDNLARLARTQDRTGEDYRRSVTGFYADLRETWERLVEELLLNAVVSRFQTGVATQSLKGVDVQDDDYSRVFHAMARVSRYSGHDTAVGRQLLVPGAAEMAADLEVLRTYADQLRRRIEQNATRRRSLEDPPVGELA